jgi:hypothetical protein
MNNVETIDENLIDLQLQEEALNLANKKAKWNANRATLSSIVNALAKIGLEPSFGDDHLNIRCTGDKDKLTAVIRILRTSGFNTTANRPAKGDSTWYAWFESANCGARIWFNFTNSVCRRVKTGSKMVSVDTYETVCGDISEELSCATALISETESTPALPNDIPF